MTAQRLRRDTLYLLTGFPIGLVAFVLVITGISLGLGLLVTIIGIPVLTVSIYIARTFADVERLRIAPVLNFDAPRPRYRRAAATDGWWRRQLTPLGDPQSWLDLAHGLLAFPITVATWCVTVSWWAITVGGIGRILYDWALPHNADNADLPELLGFGTATSTRLLFYTGAGVLFALTLYPVVRGCAITQAAFSRALLCGVAEVQAKISGLEQDKATAQEQTQTAQARTVAAVSAEATALRRLERDIHDGPQQRLVRLAMDLGRAQHQLDGENPDAAKETVAEAIAQARETLNELRALSRGIAPPILVDRGLAAALTALAGRSTVPVDLAADDLGRLEPATESTAYFVAAEALTNVAKHSHATECQISLQRTEGLMLVRVMDNGVGGASFDKGHGLAGLEDRVKSAGGRLTLTSVAGSGTIIAAELPL
jgi:signal transduction histidine kinase